MSATSSAERARAASRARWDAVPAAERARIARKTANARWSPEQKAARAALSEIRAAARSRPCVICGDPVGHAKRIRCAREDCRRAYNAKRMREGGWMHAVGYRRRARMAKAVTEKFRPAEIFERDEWICGICSLAVDPALTSPHPMSASVDHVVPVSLGGNHTRANVRLAHLVCNTKRGNKPA